MTRPEDIKDRHYQRIYQALQRLAYPCVIVVYGPERTHRTTYRGEHQSAFSIVKCESVDEAWSAVDCGYPGYPPDLEIFIINNQCEMEKVSIPL